MWARVGCHGTSKNANQHRFDNVSKLLVSLD